ncbi:MAG: aminotransferase class I/II-fold pyridoxal phosphate-dependent enzyme [Bacteroidales bacterium]|jgi:aspartate/methionine/tyrosine aminotransferase|nr:aminotransferase class I/II-fold pyridoxal phosphate-dependent enzyme [Bacteroidales bacterium]
MKEIIRISDRVTNSKQSSTVGIADIATKLRESGEVVYDFSAARAFEPTPDYIIDEAVRAMKAGDTHQTMALGTTDYRYAIAEKLRRENAIIADPESEIIATMGVKQGLTISFLALINPGDEVIVEDPCFPSYKQLIYYLGGIPVAVPLKAENKFRWTHDDLESAVSSKTKAILFNSPQNPTGVVHNREDLDIISNVAKKHNLYVLCDEVYERIPWGERKHLNLCNLPGMKERTVTLTSLTKSFSMGGWRIGYIYAHKDIISSLYKLQQHLITSCNSFVQAAAAIAFREPPREVVLEYWSEWEKKTRFVAEELDSIKGIKCPVPEGAFFVWADISQLGIPSKEFVEKLLKEKKVALVHGSSFGENGEGYFRMTCSKTWEDNREGLARIKEFIDNL